MLGLDPSTGITFGYILSYVCPHIVPPKMIFEVLIHLGTPWMYGVFGVVTFVKDFLTDSFILGDTYSVLQPQGSLFVNSVVRRFSSLH